MNDHKVLYLNLRQAESGAVGTTRLPAQYLLACSFMHCGIIDRTGTLDQGFAYATLDPIPPPATDGVSFGRLCDSIGAEIVTDAIASGRSICLLWSGGIDSTVALIAIMKAAENRKRGEVLTVLASHSSVQEYPRFFLDHVMGNYAVAPVSHPVAACVDPSAINVTGEHGDQLFGSQLLESYVRRGVAGEDYRDLLPLVALERLRNPLKSRAVVRFLEPVIAASPVPIRTLFDCMWWFNFSLKWQDVSLRLAVYRGEETRDVFKSLHHFFRDQRFQAWALANGPQRLPASWEQYKEVAKQYILEFTGDHAYFRFKEKEDSLKNVLVDSTSAFGYQIVMREDFRPEVTVVSLLPARPPAGALTLPAIAHHLHEVRDAAGGARRALRQRSQRPPRSP